MDGGWNSGGGWKGREFWVERRLSFFFSVAKKPAMQKNDGIGKGRLLSVPAFFSDRTSLGAASSVMVAALTKESRLALIVISARRERTEWITQLSFFRSRFCAKKWRRQKRGRKSRDGSRAARFRSLFSLSLKTPKALLAFPFLFHPYLSCTKCARQERCSAA